MMMPLLSTATNYGENAAKWGLDQLFWLALIAVIGVAVFAFIKKSWVGGIVTMIGGAIVCYFIKNPTKLADLGNELAKIIGF